MMKLLENTTLVTALAAGGAFTVIAAFGGSFSAFNLIGHVVGAAGFVFIGDFLTSWLVKRRNLFIDSVAPALLKTAYSLAYLFTVSSRFVLSPLLWQAGVSYGVFVGSMWLAERLARRR